MALLIAIVTSSSPAATEEKTSEPAGAHTEADLERLARELSFEVT